MPEKKIYSKPPIVERIVGVYTDLTRESFEAKLPSWIERIHGTYAVADPISEWEISVKDVGGVPVLQDAQPKAKIIHLFWKKHPKNQKVFGMRLRADRLVFHLC